MKNMRKILVLVLCAVLLCTLSACSSKRAGKVHIFSEDHQAEYEKAAKDLFSTVEWTKADFLDSIGDQMGELEDGSFVEKATGTFNTGAYLSLAMGQNDEALQNVVSAIYRFNQAAKAYFQ